MAEMLVMHTDRIGIDVYHDAKLPKKGDVITVQEDGWNWGKAELDGSHFILIKCPNVSVSELSAFLSWEQPSSPLGPHETYASLTNVLQHRGFHFDLDHASVPKGNVITLDLDAATINRMLRIKRKSKHDPKVI